MTAAGHRGAAGLLVDAGALTFYEGGLRNVVLRLLDALARRAPGLPCEVVVPPAAVGALPPAWRARAVACRFPRLHPHLLAQELAYQAMVARHWGRRRPDWRLFGMTVLTPGASGHPGAATLVADAILERDRASAGSWPRRLARRLGMRAAARAGVVLTLSEHARGDLARWCGLGRARTRVLPLWLPGDYAGRAGPEQVRAARERYGLPPRYWLYVGGYRSYKNVEGLVEAYGRARALAGAGVPPLVLAGHVPEPGWYPGAPDVAGAAARAGVPAAALVRPGFVAEDDLPAVYAGAALFASASRLEGFGYPALEAATVGTPVLVPAAASWPEVVANPECLYALDDPHDLPARLVRAAAEPARYRTVPRPIHGEAHGLAVFLRALGLDAGREGAQPV